MNRLLINIQFQSTNIVDNEKTSNMNLRTRIVSFLKIERNIIKFQVWNAHGYIVEAYRFFRKSFKFSAYLSGNRRTLFKPILFHASRATDRDTFFQGSYANKWARNLYIAAAEAM